MNRLARLPGLAASYIASLTGAIRYRDEFRSLRCYAMFVGYPRSGHTLVGALLDAHPDAVVAHELNALRYVRLGFSRSQLYTLLLDQSRRFSASGRRWTGFSYSVPEQWQGRWKRLQVIGDKKGGESARWLRDDHRLLSKLRRRVGIRVACIYVTRNPFDNIATMARRTGAPLGYCIDRYFKLREGVEVARRETPNGDFLTVPYEGLIDDPQNALSTICDFLGLEASSDYLSACAGIIFPTPHQSRSKVSWTADEVRLVEAQIEDQDGLRGYRFES